MVVAEGRRLELLRWANGRGALVLEDDCDGEYRFGGAPAPSLQSLDPDGRVICFGTFSKTLLPSLGIGYMVVPHRDIEVMARLIQSGAFESHVRAMRTLYRRRQVALAQRIRPALAGLLEIEVRELSG